MKIKARPGEFWFKALIDLPYDQGWMLSGLFFESLAGAQKAYPGSKVVWPAEMIDRDCLYVPTKEEMEEDF